MLLDLKKLKRSGKEQSSFFFEYNPDNSIIDIPSAEFIYPLTVEGTITLTGEHSAVVEGEVVFNVKGECTRCLEQTQKVFTAEFYESVSPEEEVYPIKNDVVDLSKIVDDTVMMNMPITFLCSEDCKGICLKCGVNLNDSDCKCKN